MPVFDGFVSQAVAQPSACNPLVCRDPINIFWSEEVASFIAEAPDLPRCSAWGATESDAAREAQDAIAAWVRAAQAAGKSVPVPHVVKSLEAYSGKFLVRLPRSQHARLARRAAQEGVSLNQLLTSVLAREVGA